LTYSKRWLQESGCVACGKVERTKVNDTRKPLRLITFCAYSVCAKKNHELVCTGFLLIFSVASTITNL